MPDEDMHWMPVHENGRVFMKLILKSKYYKELDRKAKYKIKDKN